MNVQRLSPKDDALHSPYWQEVHALIEHWRSDMEFFRDELNFLRNLIDRYFIWMTMEENLSEVQVAANDVVKLMRERDRVASFIKKHARDLKMLMEGKINLEGREFREDHGQLEDDLACFANKFRSVKKHVFQVSERVLESEKLQHLLSH